MWKLEVSHNDVSSVPAMAFYGLERALWELHLPHNKLTRIPSESLTLLKKLSVLNLAGKSSSSSLQTPRRVFPPYCTTLFHTCSFLDDTSRRKSSSQDICQSFSSDRHVCLKFLGYLDPAGIGG